jgi:hypothetical protein
MGCSRLATAPLAEYTRNNILYKLAIDNGQAQLAQRPMMRPMMFKHDDGCIERIAFHHLPTESIVDWNQILIRSSDV